MRCRRCGLEGVIFYEFVHLGWFWDGSHFASCPECGREHKVNLPFLIPELARLALWKPGHRQITAGGPRRVSLQTFSAAQDYFTLRRLEWVQGCLPKSFSPDDCRHNDALNEFRFFEAARREKPILRLNPSSPAARPKESYFPDDPEDTGYAAWKDTSIAGRIGKTKAFLDDFRRNLSEPYSGTLDPDFRLFLPQMYPLYYETLIRSGEDLDDPPEKRGILRLRMVDLIFPQSGENEAEALASGLEARQLHRDLARKLRRDWFQVWDEDDDEVKEEES